MESRGCFEDRAFPGRLISTNDELKEVDLSANPMTVEMVDDVKELFMIFGLERHLRSAGDT